MTNQKYIPCWKKKRLILIANPENTQEFNNLSKKLKLDKKVQTINNWSHLNPSLQELIKGEDYTVRNIKKVLVEDFNFKSEHAKQIAEFIWIRDKIRKPNIEVAMIPKYTGLYQEYKDFFVQKKKCDLLRTDKQVHEFLIQAPKEKIQYLTRNIAGVVFIGQTENYVKDWIIADSVTRKSSLPFLVFKNLDENVIRDIDSNIELEPTDSFWKLAYEKITNFFQRFANKIFARFGWSR